MAEQGRKRSSGSQSVGQPVHQPYIMDVSCPLNCPMTIPKNKVEQHVSKECVRRVFTCQHCNFKATYEEVVGTHLAECPILIQQCPYLCGTSLLPDAMQGHLELCPLREVACEFSLVGCDQMIKQHKQEEHNRHSLQKHIQLLAAATVGACQQLYCISCELDRRLVDLDEKEAKVEEKLWKQTGQHQLVLQELKEVKDDEEQMKLNQKKQEATLKLIHQQWVSSKHSEEKLTEHLHHNKKRLEEMESSLKKCNDQQQQQKEYLHHLQENLKKIDRINQQYLKEREANLKKYTDQQQQQRESLQLLQEKLRQIDSQHKQHLKQMESKLKNDTDQQLQIQYMQLEKRLKQHLDQKYETSEKQAKKKFSTFEQQMEANLKHYIDQQQQIQYLQLEKKLKQQTDQKFEALKKLATIKASAPQHSFVIELFKLQLELKTWKSHLMETHHHGYKFLVKIDISDRYSSGEKAMDVVFVLQRGQYDDYLKWPIHVDFNWELHNDCGEKLHSSIYSSVWDKHSTHYRYSSFSSCDAISISKLLPHIHNDRIYFNITSINIT